MIVITGATGHVGGALASLLAADGQPVRAMTRRPKNARLPAGVKVVYGDCDEPASLPSVFRGASRAFLMSAEPVSNAAPTHEARMVRAAIDAGVRHLVKLSVFGGGGGDNLFARWAGQAEAAVTESGLAWTLLRPGRFSSNALGWASMIQAGDTVHIPFASRPATPIDPADIAAIAAAALTGDGHHGAVYELSGPQVLTPADELRVLGEALGRDLRPVEPPLSTVRAGMRRSGLAPEVIDAIVTSSTTGTHGAEVVPTVRRVLGRPATPFAAWAAAHTDSFRHTTEIHR